MKRCGGWQGFGGGERKGERQKIALTVIETLDLKGIKISSLGLGSSGLPRGKLSTFVRISETGY